MEYDSRPKTKLFALKDEKGETKELFFVARKTMAILGVVFALIVSLIVHFFSNDIWIAIGVGVAVGLPTAFFPVYADIKQEDYFTPLLDKIGELLSEFGIDVTKQEVMDLLSFKELRINNEHVLVAETKHGELIVSITTDKIPENIKEKKPTVFPVIINAKTESDFKPKVEATLPADLEEAPEAYSPLGTEDVVEAPEGDVVEEAPEAELEDNSPEQADEEETPDEEVEEPKENSVNDVPVAISTVPASKDGYSATSTGTISIISPLTMPTPVIGEIAPGVTGPIPMTVGDGSVVYEEPAAPAKGRHGRRAAIQQ